VAHDPLEPRPRPGVAYRCPVCRLDLRFNEQSERMEVAPIDDEAEDVKRSKRTVRLPIRKPE